MGGTFARLANHGKTMSNLFENQELEESFCRKFQIWNMGERQLEDFWEDLEKVATNKIHYTGLLTIEKVSILANNLVKWNDSLFLIRAVHLL